MTSYNIAIIGAGNMGASLLGGLISTGFPPQDITVTDAEEDKLALLRKQYQINTTTNNEEAVNNASVIILAVKPQVIRNVAKQLANAVQTHQPLILSIAAGVREENIRAWLGGSVPVIRCMPNTPALIRCGATAMYANSYTNQKQRDLAENLLKSVGIVIWLDDEKHMDAVTALSGSGPAYFFLIMEALQTASEKLGLPAKTARLLTLHTAYGAARMALESNEALTELRRRITSPGGTTEAAIRALESGKLRELLFYALQAANDRSEELADQLAKGN